MIRSFKDKGLKLLWEENNHKGVPPQHAKKLRLRLTALNGATTLDDLRKTPGLNLHPMEGNRAGDWSIIAYANYRITFQWKMRGEDDAEALNITLEAEPEEPPSEEPEAGEPESVAATGDAYRVNLEDYHTGHR